MIVSCPECSKRYAIDDKVLLPHGRSVKCAACTHIWHQAPDIVQELSENLAIRNLQDVTNPPRLHKGHWPAWVGWAFFGCITALTFATFIFTRTFVMSIWPQSEGLYAMIGLPFEAPGAGLSLTNTKSHEKIENGAQMYMVSGDIINTSDRMKNMPVLKIILVGAPQKGKCIEPLGHDTCVLDRWEHHLAKSHLLPGEQVHFETSPRPKASSAAAVTVEF